MLYELILRSVVFGVTRKLLLQRKQEWGGRKDQHHHLLRTLEREPQTINLNHLQNKLVSMDNPTKFILTGNGQGTLEETIGWLRDANLLIRGRWSVDSISTQEPIPYLTVTFTKYQIGLKRFKEGLGDLQWMLNIQKIPESLTNEETLQFIHLLQKYNVQLTQESGSDEQQTGYGYGQKSTNVWPSKKRKV